MYTHVDIKAQKPNSCCCSKNKTTICPVFKKRKKERKKKNCLAQETRAIFIAREHNHSQEHNGGDIPKGNQD